MVDPAKRRAATAHVMATFGVSQRRACRVLGTSRSSQRRGDPPLRAADDMLRVRLRELALQRPPVRVSTTVRVAAHRGP